MTIFQRLVLLLKVLVMLSLGASSAWASTAVQSQAPGYVAAKTAQDPAFLATLQKLNLGYAYADDRVFGEQWSSDSTYFKSLIAKLNMKLG